MSGFFYPTGETNFPPVFRHVDNNIILSESTPVGTVVYKLEGSDPEGSNITFGSIGSEHFEVDPISGNITLIKPLDREEKDSLTFLITVRDQVSEEGESELDNIVQETVTFIISDENDNAPEFVNVSCKRIWGIFQNVNIFLLLKIDTLWSGCLRGYSRGHHNIP